jgi:chromosome segregation ATPase
LSDRSAIDQWYRRLPRYLYVEDLVAGREVVEIGCGGGVGSDFLVERGAARVVGIDRDAAALEKARQRYAGTAQFARWDKGKPLPVADASADLIVVPEAMTWLDEPGFLDELRRVLRENGQLLMAAPSADKPGVQGGISYYDLVEQLEALFSPVRMIGQTPFLAYGMVEYVESDEEPDLSLDTSLVEGSPESVSHYLALCGPDSGPLRGYSIVQIPFGPLENRVLASELPPPAPAPPPAPPPDPRIKEMQRKIADLEERLREAREKEEQALIEAEQAAGRSQKGLQDEIGALRERLAEAADERTALELETSELKRRLAEADQELGRITARATSELSELQKRAREHAEQITRLEQKLAVPQVPQVSVVELRERDERIALLEGERQGLEWRVQELEGRLAAGEHKWEGIVQDLEERLRSREVAFEEARVGAEKHRAEMAARDEGSAEQVAAVLELEEELGTLRGQLTETEKRAAEAARRAEEAEGRERDVRQRASQAEGEILRLKAVPPQIVKDTAEIEAAHRKASALEEQTRLAEQKVAEAERKAVEAEQRSAEAVQKAAEAEQRAVQKAAEADQKAAQADQKVAQAQDEAAKAKEKAALAASQTDVWMTKFRESERKAEEARSEATRKLLDAKSAAGTQLRLALEESTNNLARARDEAQRAEKQRREAQQKLDEITREIEGVRIERDDARHKLGEAEAARARGEQRLAELAGVIADREAQLERLAGVAVVERRAAEEAVAREKEVREAVEQAAAARAETAREAKAALEQVTKLQVEIDAMRSEAERLAGQARMREREVEAHVAGLEKDLSEAKAQIDAATHAGESKLTEAAASVSQQAAEITELKAQAARLDKELQASKRELGEAQKEAKDKQKALDKLADDAHERKAELAKVRREAKDKERALAATQEQLVEAEEKAARLMDEVAAVGKQLARQEKAKATTTKKDKETEDALARLREEIKFRKADLEETEAALKKTRELEEQQRLEILRRDAEIEKLAAARDKAEEHAKAESDLRKKAVEEAERAGERAQQARGEVVAARGELSKARGAMQAAEESERKLKVAAEETKERIKQLKRELEQAEKKTEREAEHAARLEKDIEARVRAGDSAASELAELRKKLAEMSAQATARSARIGELEVAIEEAKRERNEYERALRAAEAGRNGEPGRKVAEIGARLQAFEAGLHLEEERLTGIEELIQETMNLAKRLVDPAPLEAKIVQLSKTLEKREEELQENLMEIDRLRTEERKLSTDTEDALREAVLATEIGDKEAEILVLHGKIAGWQRRVAKLREAIAGYKSRAGSLTPEEIRGMLYKLSTEIEEMEK